MKIFWKLFTIALLYVFLAQALYYIPVLYLVNRFPQYALTTTQFLPFLSLTIIIEFGIFYLVGEKHKLKESLFPSIVSLYLGAVMGLIIETLLTIIVTPYLGGGVVVDGWYLAYSLALSLVSALSHLFTAVAGIAVGNIRHGAL